MFARKLKALAYPDAENFAVDEPAFKSLVVWLEDSKIRHMPIEDRAPLRDVDGAGWQATLAQVCVPPGAQPRTTRLSPVA